MSRIGRLPIPVPGRRRVTIDGQHGHGQGPQGHAVAHRRRADHGRAGRGRHPRGHPARRRARVQGAARPVPHPDRTTWSSASPPATARRWRSSAPVTASRPRARTWSSRSASATRCTVNGAGGHHLHGRGPDPVRGRGHRQAEGRRGRRQHPQAAQARPVQGQGRALPGRESSAARPERRVSSHGCAATVSQERPASAGRLGPPSAGKVAPALPAAQEGRRFAGASAPGRHPLVAAHVRAGRRRHRRADAGLGLDLRAGRPRTDGDKTAQAAPGRQLSPSAAKAAGVTGSSSTAAATTTPAGSRRSPTPPAKPDWSSDESTPQSETATTAARKQRRNA